MFTAGTYYLQKITTGFVKFNSEGVPVPSPTQFKEVYYFTDNKAAGELLGQQGISREKLEPDTDYWRMFQAPKASYDSEGNLINPRFLTVCFFEVGADVARTLAGGRINEMRKDLPQPVLDLFGEIEDRQ